MSALLNGRNAGGQPGVFGDLLGGLSHRFLTASGLQAQTLACRFCLSPWMARDMARLCFGEGGHE